MNTGLDFFPMANKPDSQHGNIFRYQQFTLTTTTNTTPYFPCMACAN